MEDFYVNVGNRIRSRRKELGLTGGHLAQLAYISEKFLYCIETGKKGLSAETLYNLAKALGVTADWVLGG